MDSSPVREDLPFCTHSVVESGAPHEDAQEEHRRRHGSYLKVAVASGWQSLWPMHHLSTRNQAMISKFQPKHGILSRAHQPFHPPFSPRPFQVTWNSGRATSAAHLSKVATCHRFPQKPRSTSEYNKCSGPTNPNQELLPRNPPPGLQHGEHCSKNWAHVGVTKIPKFKGETILTTLGAHWLAGRGPKWKPKQTWQKTRKYRIHEVYTKMVFTENCHQACLGRKRTPKPRIKDTKSSAKAEDEDPQLGRPDKLRHFQVVKW